MKYLFVFCMTISMLSLKSCKQPENAKQKENDSTEVATSPSTEEEDSVSDNEEMDEVEVASGSN